MIPLIRPTFPPMHVIEKYFRDCYKTKNYTNFGDLHTEVTIALRKVMGGYVLPVTSGTTALQIAMKNLRLQGARVVVPDFTHSGTFLSVKMAGAEPVIMACDPDTWVLDPVELMSQASKFDAIIVVSPFGYYVNVPFWDDLAKRLGKKLIYDFAGAFGFFPETENLKCYSFHATKNFGVGEGGAIVHPSVQSWEESRRISNFGTLEDRSIQDEFGINGKIDEFRCAAILAQLESLYRVWTRIQNKNALIEFYKTYLKGIRCPVGPKRPSLTVFNNFEISDIEARSLDQGIVVKKYYPLLSQMDFAEKFVCTSGSKKLEYCYALPCDVSLSEAMKVVECIKQLRGS